jgi:hypothetical protein
MFEVVPPAVVLGFAVVPAGAGVTAPFGGVVAGVGDDDEHAPSRAALRINAGRKKVRVHGFESNIALCPCA